MYYEMVKSILPHHLDWLDASIKSAGARGIGRAEYYAYYASALSRFQAMGWSTYIKLLAGDGAVPEGVIDIIITAATADLHTALEETNKMIELQME